RQLVQARTRARMTAPSAARACEAVRVSQREGSREARACPSSPPLACSWQATARPFLAGGYQPAPAAPIGSITELSQGNHLDRSRRFAGPQDPVLTLGLEGRMSDVGEVVRPLDGFIS